MNAALIKLIQDIRSSYWFVPTLMAIAAVALASVTNAIDSRLDGDWLQSYPGLHFNEPAGARAMLTTIAGSMITVASVTFSMTMVAVSFASAQFGPRLIGNFMRDRGNQITLGTFISAFVYSLIVLRSVRGAEADTRAYVPHISMLTAVALALSSVAVLIYFIHHVPETINIGQITAKLGRDLRVSVGRLFPEELLDCAVPIDEPRKRLDESTDPARIRSRSDGYLQAVDQDALLELATRHDLVVRIQYRPGDFVVRDATLIEARPKDSVTEDVGRQLATCFATGHERTSTQDTLFLVDQLVEILARALSPGVNDPFTACSCIDWLRAGLHEIVRRRPPRAECYDDNGDLRIVVHPISFQRFTSTMFDQSRQYVARDLNAALRMMAAIAEVTLECEDAEQRRILMHHATHLVDACSTALSDGHARGLVEERLRELETLLESEANLRRARDDQGWLGGSA